MENKVQRFYQILKENDLDPDRYDPTFFRLMRHIGIPAKPPCYNQFLWNMVLFTPSSISAILLIQCVRVIWGQTFFGISFSEAVIFMIIANIMMTISHERKGGNIINKLPAWQDL